MNEERVKQELKELAKEITAISARIDKLAELFAENPGDWIIPPPNQPERTIKGKHNISFSRIVQIKFAGLGWRTYPHIKAFIAEFKIQKVRYSVSLKADYSTMETAVQSFKKYVIKALIEEGFTTDDYKVERVRRYGADGKIYEA